MIVLLNTIVSCQLTSNEYQINGIVNDNLNGKAIMLFKFKADTIWKVDTAYIKDGKFFFEGEEELDDVSILSVGNYPDKVFSAELALEKGIIHVKLDSISEVRGTPINDNYSSYKSTIRKYNDSIKTCDKEIIHDIIDAEYQYQKNWIANNVNVPTARMELRNWYYNIANDSLFVALYELIPGELQTSPDLKEKYERTFESIAANKKQNELVNQEFIDFELITLNKKKSRLSDYIGKSKYVFLEFTASWCGPCRADIPNLKTLYEQYKDNGFEIISISVDDDYNQWKRFIEEEDAPWIHLSNLEGVPSDLTKAYGVDGVPHGVLIDREGKIISTKLSGLFLLHFNTLGELFEKENL